MNKSLTLIACAVAFSTVLVTQKNSYADALGGKDLGYTLDKELHLLAQADHAKAAHKKNKHEKKNRKKRYGKAKKRHAKKSKNRELARQWRDYDHKRTLRHRDLGRFADLFLQPAWPVHAQYVNKDHVVSVDLKFAKATAGFNNSGVLGDVARTSLADGDVRLRDVLLASKLVSDGISNHRYDFYRNNAGGVAALASPAVPPVALPSDAYLGYHANSPLVFDGSQERLEAGFNVARYFFNHRFAVGLFVPVVQDRRMLRVSIDSSYEDITSKFANGAAIQAPAQARYGNDTALMMRDILAAKGLNNQGGTSVGLGDVQFYAQVNAPSKYLERALLSFRAVIPTAAQAATNRLWAPERGNGGVYQAGVAFSAAGRYNKYFNPHYSIEGVYSLPATQNRRVPVKVAFQTAAAAAAATAQLDKIPLGYRLDQAIARDYSAYDAAFRDLGDTVSTLKVARGLQFDMRIGNVFERAFVYRGFLDLYYNLKMKSRDRAYGVPQSDYLVKSYEDNSEQLEHRLGGEWRWQVNHNTTLRLGLEQVVKGKNVAQYSQLSAGFNYGF